MLFFSYLLKNVVFSSGDCNCGKCVCDTPYEGKFCQYKCPVDETNRICGGPTNGVCLEGKCKCNENFKGENCNCPTSTKNCRFSSVTALCSNNGICTCNTCQCKENFTGSFCEQHGNSENLLCGIYTQYVKNKVLENISTTTEHNFTTRVFLMQDGITDKCGK